MLQPLDLRFRDICEKPRLTCSDTTCYTFQLVPGIKWYWLGLDQRKDACRLCEACSRGAPRGVDSPFLFTLHKEIMSRQTPDSPLRETCLAGGPRGVDAHLKAWQCNDMSRGVDGSPQKLFEIKIFMRCARYSSPNLQVLIIGTSWKVECVASEWVNRSFFANTYVSLKRGSSGGNMYIYCIGKSSSE